MRDKECLTCKHMIDCTKGKPEGNKRCIDYEKRTPEEPKKRYFR